MVAGIERSAFVGRDRELARLEAAFDGITRSPPAGRTIIVGGEAGIGKTRLVGGLQESAGARRATVLVGACLPTASGSVPYAPFVEALRDLTRSIEPALVAGLLGPARGEIARLLPEFGARAGPPRSEGLETDRAGQGRLFEAILTVLERRGRDGPVVLTIEDVQWADVGTRGLVTFLSRNLRLAPVLLLVTVRTDDLEPSVPTVRLLAELERNAWVERIELGPLKRSDVVALLRSLDSEGSDEPVADEVVARAGGNPFFVEQLAAATPGTAGDHRLPPGLRDVLVDRLATLPDATRSVLRAAAAAGRRVDDEVLAAVLGLTVSAVADALRPAVAHGVLVDADATGDGLGGYAFRHALLAEVAYGELLHGERDRLHTGFGRELERRGEVGGVAVTPAELAYHWVAARDRDRAIPALIRAGQAAESVYAFAEAGRHYERALALWEDDPDDTAMDRGGVLERAAECAVLTGSYARAIELGRKAIMAVELADIADGRSDPVRLGLLHERLRWFLWESGDRVAADAAVAEALRLIPTDPPSVARSRALGQAAGLRLFGGDAAGALVMAQQAVDVARAAQARSEEAFGLGVLGWAEAVTGHVDRGIATYRAGLLMAEALGGAEGIALGHANLAALLDRVGRTEESLAAAREGYAITQRLGVARTYGGGLLGHVAKALFDLGRWDEAAAAADEGLELDPVGAAAIWLHVNRARVDANRGTFTQAADHLRRAATVAADTGSDRYRAALAAATAELAAWTGQLETARAVADAAVANLDRTAPIDPALGWLAWHALRAEAEASLSARARHDDHAQGGIERRVAPIADILMGGGRAPDQDLRRVGLAGLCRGELDRIHGTSSAEAWDRTAAAWDSAGRPAPAAYARFRSAETRIAARDDRAVATASLRDAHAIADRLGATPLRLEIERLARHARIDIVGATQAGSDEAGDGLGLTDREAEVIRHVAAGRSNQQIADALFITRKTASVHVSNILAKLGVANRVEAAAIAQRLGLVDPPEG